MGAFFFVGTEFSLGIFASIGGNVSRPLFKRNINTVPGNETWISTLAEKPRDQKVIKAGRGRSSCGNSDCTCGLTARPLEYGAK